MNDDTTSLKDLVTATAMQHGWIVAFATTTWAVALRAFIGVIQADRKQLRDRLKNIEGILGRYDERLKHIEARSTFRRRGDEQELLDDNGEDSQ